MNEPFDSGPVRLGRYTFGGLDMYGMERLLSVFDVKADRVYNGVSAGKRIRDRPLVVNIGVDGSKLRIITAKLTLPPIWMPWRSGLEIRDRADAGRCGGRENRLRRTR